MFSLKAAEGCLKEECYSFDKKRCSELMCLSHERCVEEMGLKELLGLK